MTAKLQHKCSVKLCEDGIHCKDHIYNSVMSL